MAPLPLPMQAMHTKK